jgi:triosephosphate isomerase
MLKKPLIIVNCKTYKEASGANAIKLAKICEHVALERKANIAIAVQAVDIARVVAATSIPVLAQHVDGVEFGAHTGAILPQALKDLGAAGSLINHSEWRIPLKNIDASIKMCDKVGLDVIACADTPENAKQIAALKPAFIAIEPPELIGGKISVSVAKPEVIMETVHAVQMNKIKSVPVLCGAGIHTTQDVKRACELGSVGILLASGVVLAKDPEKALHALVDGLQVT